MPFKSRKQELASIRNWAIADLCGFASKMNRLHAIGLLNAGQLKRAVKFIEGLQRDIDENWQRQRKD